MLRKWRVQKNIVGRKLDKIHREENPGDDPGYLAWLRRQHCAVKTHPFPGATHCQGITEAHHPTGAGMAKKAPDRRAFPLCALHHRPGFHDGHDPTFAGWKRERRNDWQDEMSATYRAKYERTKT